MGKLVLISVVVTVVSSVAYAGESRPWSGFYVGLNSGVLKGTSTKVNTSTTNTYLYTDPSDPPDPPSNQASANLFSNPGASSSNPASYIGGGQIGYNWQPLDRFVVGLEADFQGIAGSGNATNYSGSANPVDFVDGDGPDGYHIQSSQNATNKISTLGTARARIGFLAQPSLLLYGTGGLAYGQVKTSVQNNQSWIGFGGDGTDPNHQDLGYDYDESGSGSQSRTQLGWTLGGGLEWMFVSNWSLKLEYLYYDLGTVSGSFETKYLGTGVNSAGWTGTQSVTNYNTRFSGNTVRAGINYHF